MGDVHVQDGLDLSDPYFFFAAAAAVGVGAVRSSLHYLRGLYQNEGRVDLDFTIRIRSDQIAYCAIGFILLLLGWLLDKIHSWFIISVAGLIVCSREVKN
jgi:hypothetical protein